MFPNDLKKNAITPPNPINLRVEALLTFQNLFKVDKGNFSLANGEGRAIAIKKTRDLNRRSTYAIRL